MTVPAVPVRRAGGVPVVRRAKPASTSTGSQMGPLDRFVTAAANFLPIILLVVLVGFFLLIKEVMGPTVSIANEAVRTRFQFSDVSVIDSVPLIALDGSDTDCETPISMGDTVTFHVLAKTAPEGATADTAPETIVTTYGVDVEPYTRKLLTIAGDSRSGDLTPAYLRMLRGACPGARLSATFPAEARLATTVPVPATTAAEAAAEATQAVPVAVKLDIEVLTVAPRTAADDEAEAAAQWAAASPMGRLLIGLRSVNPLVYVAVFVGIRAFRSYSSAGAGGRTRTVSLFSHLIGRVKGAAKAGGK